MNFPLKFVDNIFEPIDNQFIPIAQKLDLPYGNFLFYTLS